MLLGVDVWEGSMDIDEPVLLAAGVKYIIIRLNDMNGGHHKDANFDSQWQQSEAFLRAPYFVYNPWVTGKINAEFLLDNLPAQGVTRVFPDIEVRKTGYDAATYAAEVRAYKTEVSKYIPLPQVCYTGEWFLSCLSSWPTDWEYWWARYPWALYPSSKQTIAWDTLRLMIDAVGWKPDPLKRCPGLVRLWQCTADRYIPPGCAGRPIDVIMALMTAPELTNWWGASAPAIDKVGVMWRELTAHYPNWNWS